MKSSILLLTIALGLSAAQTQTQNLKRKLMYQYDKTTKPEGVVSVKIKVCRLLDVYSTFSLFCFYAKVRPVNIQLCPHSETMTLTTWNT